MGKFKSFLDFLEQGNFDRVALGDKRSEILQRRGPPDKRSRSRIGGVSIEAIWKYGSMEVFFDAKNIVVGLLIRVESNAVPTATLPELRDALQARGISFKVEELADTAAVRFALGRSRLSQCSFRQDHSGVWVLESISGFSMLSD